MAHAPTSARISTAAFTKFDTEVMWHENNHVERMERKMDLTRSRNEN